MQVLAVLVSAFAWLFATGDGRHALRVLRYEWLQGMPLVWSVPRRVMECPPGPSPRRLVLLAFGQSNAANSARGRHTAGRSVLNFHDGKCYAGEDPVPGATGTGGSAWNRLGDLLVASGRYDNVVLASVAVDASAIAQWSPGGELHPRLLAALRGLRTHGLEPDRLLWQQGERDAQLGTDAKTYAARFARMLESLRKSGFTMPVHVARSSYCRGQGSEAVRAAQLEVLDRAAGVLPGPYTDALVAAGLRHDDCHFSAAGAEQQAALWRDALLADGR